MKSFLINKLTYFVAISLLFLNSCGSPYQPEEEPEEQIPAADEVPPDATLEAVTWNLQWYGSGFSGPSDFEQQTKNIIRVIDSLDADLFAFQEVNGQTDLNKIVNKMKGYDSFIAEHVGQNQKMAFAYNTNTIDSLNAGAISSTNIREEYKQNWNHNWAGGRTPLYFSFNYTFEGNTQTFYAVVIHGKANTGDNDQEYQEAYQRRRKAAEGLYYYLNDHKPDANIILLGDYNDDLDQSIYYEEQNGEKVYQETPYYQFVNDSTNFDAITKKLSDSGESASVNDKYEDIIDHITISNEVSDLYVTNSTAVYKAPQSYINNYGVTTSDHLPVWAKFDVTKTSGPAKISP